MNLPDAIQGLERGRVVGVVGMPGGGKTEDAMQIICLSPWPVFAIDPVGALTDKLHGKDVWLVHIPKGFDLDATWRAARAALDRDEKVVWDVRDWEPEELQEMVDALVSRLKTLEDCIVVVDEVQYVAPEFSADMGRGARRFKTWALKRRNQPVALVWTSQRPAIVSMTLRGITDYWIVHRLFYPNDIDVVRNLLRKQPGVDADLVATHVQSFSPGQFVSIDLPFTA